MARWRGSGHGETYIAILSCNVCTLVDQHLCKSFELGVDGPHEDSTILNNQIRPTRFDQPDLTHETKSVMKNKVREPRLAEARMMLGRVVRYGPWH